jgi:PST family polysaccharide transporter
MNLIKTSSLNAIAVVVKMLVGLFLNKILAVYVGPAGYAVIGQFQNAITMITNFASGAINTGVVKYTAEYSCDESQQIRVWQTATKISVVCSVIIALLITLFNRQLAVLFLQKEEYGSLFLWFSCFLLFFVLNALLLAILNGKKDVERYVLANISGSLLMGAVTGMLAKSAGLYGALLALCINQSVTFLATLCICHKAQWFQLQKFWGAFDRGMAKKLGGFTLMALISATTVPITQILIRNKIVQELGWAAAGHWQGVWRISEMYLMVVTTTLSVYYLPRIAELSDAAELKLEIMNGFKKILPVAAIGALTIYVLREWLVQILFTKDFAAMKDYFVFQLIGDVVKIASWLLGYVLLGKALIRLFITTEIIFNLLFVIMSNVLIPAYGIQGVTGSFLATYILYFITIYVLLTRYRHI